MTARQRHLLAVAALGVIGLGIVQIKGEPSVAGTDDIHKIAHVVIIMQENRSFDSYFGTYPLADGIPRNAAGTPTACVPDPVHGGCQRPYHDPSDSNNGGPHSAPAALADIDGGRMDGFIRQAEQQVNGPCTPGDLDPRCAPTSVDVMGYHDRRELPVYWSYADNFVLQDHMFEPNFGWSLPSHLFMVSGWSASCRVPTDPSTCQTDLDNTDHLATGARDWAWTDLTFLLHQARVSWAYYVAPGSQPDCADGAMSCPSIAQDPTTPSIWNPLPDFQTVREDNQVGNVQSAGQFLKAAATGQLPAVSWVVPSEHESDHPPALVSVGQAYVANLVNTVMRGPDWSSTAIFLAWDDWGGFYDHVLPPKIDSMGYGLRVPGLVISPYAKKGFIDHQTLSFDAYLKFIEDDFLGGARIDPVTDGRPDPRPTVRERAAQLGDLRSDFNFAQLPRPPQPLLIVQGNQSPQERSPAPLQVAVSQGLARQFPTIAVPVGSPAKGAPEYQRLRQPNTNGLQPAPSRPSRKPGHSLLILGAILGLLAAGLITKLFAKRLIGRRPLP